MLDLLRRRLEDIWRNFPDMRIGQVMNTFCGEFDRPIYLIPDDEFDALLRTGLALPLPSNACSACGRVLPIAQHHFIDGECPDCAARRAGCA